MTMRWATGAFYELINQAANASLNMEKIKKIPINQPFLNPFCISSCVFYYQL